MLIVITLSLFAYAQRIYSLLIVIVVAVAAIVLGWFATLVCIDHEAAILLLLYFLDDRRWVLSFRRLGARAAARITAGRFCRFFSLIMFGLGDGLGQVSLIDRLLVYQVLTIFFFFYLRLFIRILFKSPFNYSSVVLLMVLLINVV